MKILIYGVLFITIMVIPNLYSDTVTLYIRNLDLRTANIIVKEKELKGDWKRFYKAQLFFLEGKYRKTKNILKRTQRSKTEKIRVMSEYLLNVIEIQNGLSKRVENLTETLQTELNNEENEKALNTIETIIMLDPANIEYRIMYSEIAVLMRFPILAIKKIMDVIYLYPATEKDIDKIIEILTYSFILLEQYKEMNIPIDLHEIHGFNVKRVIDLIRMEKYELSKLEFMNILKRDSVHPGLRRELIKKLEKIILSSDILNEKKESVLKLNPRRVRGVIGGKIIYDEEKIEGIRGWY